MSVSSVVHSQLNRSSASAIQVVSNSTGPWTNSENDLCGTRHYGRTRIHTIAKLLIRGQHFFVLAGLEHIGPSLFLTWVRAFSATEEDIWYEHHISSQGGWALDVSTA
jgi:hypothetical protein